jgi:hypothetical protein
MLQKSQAIISVWHCFKSPLPIGTALQKSQTIVSVWHCFKSPLPIGTALQKAKRLSLFGIASKVLCL